MKRVMMAMIVATLFAGMITGCSIKKGSASEGKNICCEQEEDGTSCSGAVIVFKPGTPEQICGSSRNQCDKRR